MDPIFTRRSIRKYTSEPVSDELVVYLLKAAMAAPSAHNQQPWQFVVVRDKVLLERLAAHQPYAGMVKDAQLAIVVCGDLTLEKSPDFWVQDCSAATENLLLAATAAGLGAVWTATYPRAERVANARAILQLPDHIIPFAVVPVGYPADQPAPVDRFDPSRIHNDLW